MSDAFSDKLAGFFQGSGLVFAGFSLWYLLSFLTTFVLIRALSPENYGIISVGITIVTTGSVVLQIGLNQGVARFLPRQDTPAQIKSTIIGGLSVLFPITVVTIILLNIKTAYISNLLLDGPNYSFVIRFFSVAIAPAVFTQYVISVSRGVQTTIPKVIIKNISQPIAIVVFVLGALTVGGGLYYLSLGYVLAHTAVALLSLYYLYKLTPVFDRSVPLENKLSELLPFSVPLLFTTSMTVIMSNIDVFLLGIWSSTSSIGLYKTAYQIAQLLMIVYTSFRFLLLPLISEMHAEELWNEINSTYSIICNNIFITTFPLFIIISLYPSETISFVFEAEYVTETPLLPILTLGFFIHAFAGPDKNILISAGNTRSILYIGGTGAVVNIILNVILIPKYSYQGAAIATTASYLVINILYILSLYKFYSVFPFNRRTVKIIIISALWLGLMMFLSRNIDLNGIQVFALGVMTAMTYIPSTFLLSGPNEAEWEAIKSTVSKLMNSLGYE